jgi:hypothetical protein
VQFRSLRNSNVGLAFNRADPHVVIVDSALRPDVVWVHFHEIEYRALSILLHDGNGRGIFEGPRHDASEWLKSNGYTVALNGGWIRARA